jgi:hypothetical protein
LGCGLYTRAAYRLRVFFSPLANYTDRAIAAGQRSGLYMRKYGITSIQLTASATLHYVRASGTHEIQWSITCLRYFTGLCGSTSTDVAVSCRTPKRI